MNYNPHGLSSADYEHSSDREALAVLRKVPLVDKLLASYIDFNTKFSQGVIAKGDYYKVTATTCPRLYKLYQTALERLNMDCEPDLYIKPSFDHNACALGANEHMIFVNSSCLKKFTDGELLLDLGHELGHIKSGHLLYYNLASSINRLPKMLKSEFAHVLSGGLDYAIMDWKRKSEYTADRAGMIAALDYNASQGNMLKYLGGGSIPDVLNISPDEVLKQCDDFEEAQNSVIGKLIYIKQTIDMTHPWSITRMKELEKWYKSGEFDALVTKYNIK